MNYPALRPSHNYLEVYLGNITKKEKKNISLKASIVLNSPNVSLNLPLLEVSVEYLGVKNFSEYSFINSHNTMSNNNNIIKRKTQGYTISLPIIPYYKDITYSNSTYIKYQCAKVAEYMSASLECFKSGRDEDCLRILLEAKHFYEGIRTITPLFKYVDTSFTHYNLTESKFINDDSIVEILKNMKSVNHNKMFHFSMMILMDINELIEKVRNKTIVISEFYIIMHSLAFIRPVNIQDDRFVDDIIDLI
jgi:hypothetical protein